MNILITGEHETGKSILANKIKNYIFKVDKDSKISLRDSSEPDKVTGHGANEYVIVVNSKLTDEDLQEADVIITIKNQVLLSTMNKL